MIYRFIYALPYVFRKDIKLGLGAYVKDVAFEGHNKIGSNSIMIGSLIGFGTYCGINTNLSKCKIGRYCSIGSNIGIINITHPVNFVSTHPTFFSLKKQNGFTYTNEQKFSELVFNDDGNIVIIGNDVWICNNVTILGGIRIGDGAVIGAGAIVTKDVEPYTVVAGIPARPVKKRFNDEQITFLLDFKWWDKSEEWIIKHSDLFDNIDDFIDTISKE